MIELDDFYNQGFGWICKRCEQELSSEAVNESTPRVWREGEAESKQPKLSAPVAKWFNAARTQLICPRCRITEMIGRA